jgi:uncharacterized membrane protein (Fun14 family)
MTDIITSDSIIFGAAGFGAGYFVGYLLKKTMKILFKLSLVLLSVFVTALFYLQSIKVIAINEHALNNLINSGYQQLNNTIGTEAIANPAHYVITALGLPLTTGITGGFLIGWVRS